MTTCLSELLDAFKPTLAELRVDVEPGIMLQSTLRCKALLLLLRGMAEKTANIEEFVK